MNQDAKLVRDTLKGMKPSKRQSVLRPASEDVDLNEVPGSRIAIAHVDGLGETGVKQLIIALGLWLEENDITEHPINS
ncbi:hypothetical protein GF348_24245 [candidate division KSB3 bacterium]|nr:hypothetical protein [candidate division KSB3 bacterium]